MIDLLTIPVPLWVCLPFALSVVALVQFVKWLVWMIWPPLLVIPEGATVDIKALSNGHKVLWVPAPRKWKFKE